MRRLYIKIALSIVLITAVGCDMPSKEDRAKLKELQTKFGERYKFRLDTSGYGLCVYVRLKPGTTIQQDEDIEMYKMFRFIDFSKNEERYSCYYYFNFYDAKGRFMYRLTYSPSKQTFYRGDTPYD